jgi:tetratricopeptide (TPR) repeat protein
MGIGVLNGDWFFDDITPRGISFDGFLPQACKTPLGNMKDFELIHTPITMANFQTSEMHEKNPGLAEILLTVAPLQSPKEALFTEYKIALGNELCKPCTTDACHHGTLVTQAECRAINILRKDVSRYEELITGRNPFDDGKLYDVKKEIYRLTDRVIAGLAKCFGSKKSGSFEILDELHKKGVLSSIAQENIASAAAVALKLRNITYLEAGKQGEQINTNRDEKKNEPVYNMPKEKELFHFFYVTIPLYDKLHQVCDQNDLDSISQELFFDYSDKVKGDIYCRLLKYTRALQCYDQAVAANPGDVKLQLCLFRVKFVADNNCDSSSSKCELDALRFLMCKKYNLPENIELLSHALSESDCDITKADKGLIFEILMQTSQVHILEGNFELAREFIHQCLIAKNLLDMDDLQTLIARTLRLQIPTVRRELKIQEFDSIIRLLTNFIEDEGVSTKGYILLNELGQIFLLQKNYDTAYQCFQRAFSMGLHIFSKNANFLMLQTTMWLGQASLSLLMYDESRFYFEQALQMFSSCGTALHVVEGALHLMIADVCNITSDYYNALSHLQECIESSSGTSPHITALAHCSLATTWSRLGESEKACKSAFDAKDCLQNIVDMEAKAMITCAVAQTLVEVKRSEEAISFLKEELLALDSSNCDSDLRAFYLHTLAQMCHEEELTSEALHYYTECLEILNVKKVNISGILNAHLAIANILHLTGALSEANAQLNEGWNHVLSMSDGDEKNEFMKKFADCWEKMGNIREAQKCYSEVLTALRFTHTRKVPLFEFELMVKLGDLAKIVSNEKASYLLSAEQRQKAQRIHYDNAAAMLRRHSASGNFNSSTILLFTLLAHKYRSIDVFEQEKLLLEALQMCDVVYPPNGVSEITVDMLCDLSDIYWDRSNMSKSSDYYIPAFRMEMELHSSDPYHQHITMKVPILASLLFADSENKEIRSFVKQVVKFIESAQGQMVTHEQKANSANSFTSMSYLFICLGDLARSRLFYQKANEIFDKLEKGRPPNDNTSDTAIKEVIGKILDIFPESPNSDARFSQLFSSGLIASYFRSMNVSPSTSKEVRKMPKFSELSSAFNSLKVTAPIDSRTHGSDARDATVRNNLLSTRYPFRSESNELEKLGLVAKFETDDFDNQSGSTQKRQENRKPESSNQVDINQVTEQTGEKLKPSSLCGQGTTKQQSIADSDDKELPDPLTIISGLNVLGDSAKYDLHSGNMNQAKETMESFHHLLVPTLDKYYPNPADVFISEALRCKEEKRMDLMPPYLELSAQFTSDNKKKAEISKLMAESHFNSRKYKMATIQFVEAATYYSCHTDTDSVVDYLAILSGLTKSHMRCNDLEEARRVCEEAIEFTSRLECGFLKLQYEAEFLYLVVTCLMRLAKMNKQTENKTLENVASYCQRGIYVIETAEQQLGSSDVADELTGDVRGKLFAFKCEIQLLLAKSYLQLGRKELADTIVKEMSEFLQNISVVVEMFSEETWPGDKSDFSKIRRRMFSWIGRAQILSGRTEHAIGSLEESLLLFLSNDNVVNVEQEEFIDLLDAFTATKKVKNESEITSFYQTVQFCKEKFQEKTSHVEELLTFLQTLASYYVECERTEEAIVVYEIMLPVTECMGSSIGERYGHSQILLSLGNCHQRQALKRTGKGTIEERRLAEKCYQMKLETNEPATLLRKVKYLEMLTAENRLEEASGIITQIFEVGDKIWDMMVIFPYSSRDPCAQSYLSDHGEVVTNVGCFVYCTLLRVFLQMGKKKEAVETCEELSKQGRDVGFLFKRPSFMPYLLAYCHKMLVSSLEKKDNLHFQDSDFPLSDKNVAQVYYEMGEYEVALEYCKKALSSVGSSLSALPQDMDLVQMKLDCLRLSGNALVLLGKGNYYISFLELLEAHDGILKKSFEDQQIILGKYDFADLYFVYRSLGILLCRAGHIDGAIKVYEYCTKTLNADYQYGHGLVATLGELYQTKAFATLDDDETTHSMWMNKAKTCFENYFQTEDNPDPFVETAFGALLYRLEEHHKAIFHLENVIQRNDKTIVQFNREDIPLVGVHLAREIEARKEIVLPLNIYARLVAASLYRKLNKTDKAEQVVCKMENLCSGLKSDPNYPLILSVLGYAHKDIGNDDKAAEIFRSVLDVQPGHIPVTIALQNCLSADKHTSSY